MIEQTQINEKARVLAIEKVVSQQVQTTDLIEFQSRGRVVVIGDEEAMEFAPRLREHKLSPVVLLVGGSVEAGEVVLPVGGRKIVIDGYLGNFTIAIGDKGKPNFEILETDLLLDLSKQPLLEMAIKPPGYYTADSNDEVSLLKTITQLQEMTGTFEKPRYFDYDASICAHSRSGQAGCTRCIDACPTQAITSLADAIEVNPYLCQGGGVCDAVCPTGAIRYVYPGAQDMMAHTRQLLQHYYNEGGKLPIIAFISVADYEQVGAWPERVLPVVVEELASVGMDTWLSALAYGASAVMLVDAGSVPEGVNNAITEQLSFSRSLLQGMHYHSDVIRMVTVDELDTLAMPLMAEIDIAKFSGNKEKRRVLYSAIDHLIKNAKDVADEIALPDSAPFGRIHVDGERCTLCMGCTAVCPTTAVQAGNDVPRLVFVESICVQCGLCQVACPEHAIRLQPRMLTDLEQRRAKIILHEEKPFNCVSCGKPFATQSIINTIMSKLTGHAMFQSERAKQRLKMCEDCRVVDAVQDVDAMSAGLVNKGQDDTANRL